MSLENEFATLRLELSVKAKNGLDFIVAATVVWAGIAVVWALPGTAAHKGFVTFFVGARALPLAWGLSKVFGTTWALPHNPLQPLGLWLWLNFAQLFYFPLLLFIFGHSPTYFTMAYGIITGAHFFPYAWFYKAPAYAVMAGVISGGCLLIGVRTAQSAPCGVPVFVTVALLPLATGLWQSYRQHARAYGLAGAVASEPAPGVKG